MKNARLARFGLSIVLACTIFLSGCSSLPIGGPLSASARQTSEQEQGRSWTHVQREGRATVAYMWGFSAANYTPQTILQYPIAPAEGSSPSATLQIPSQYSGWGLTSDSSGQLYVGVTNAANDPQVLVYAAGASGAASPTRVLDVEYDPHSLFVDETGKLYVGSNGATRNIVVSVYAADATGWAAPLRTVQSTTNKQIVDISADRSGNIYVAGLPLYDTGNIPYGFIDVYTPDAVVSAEPVRSISFPVFIDGVTVDCYGNIFVSVESSLNTGVSQPASVAVEEFAPDANGYATPVRLITLPQQAVPDGELGSSGAGGGPVRFDGAGNIFTPEITGMGGSFNYILYKIAPATSDPVPVAEINPSNGFDFIFTLK